MATTEPPYLKHAAEGVRRLEPYTPGMPIEELQRRLGLRDVIKLASNENPLGASPRARAALAQAVGASSGELARYPDGGGFRLKRRIAEFHDIGPERVTLGNGSNDILEFVARVFLAPGRQAMFARHAFAVYPIVTQAQGARALVVPANPADHPMPYGHDLDAFRRALTADVAVVFIANPNNPTGTWAPSQAIESFLDAVPPQVIVVLDEAYYEYLDPAQRGDSRAWLERYPNLVVTRTFSKVYGLASLRAGYGLSSAATADLFNRVRQPFNMNALALLAAEAALADTDHVTHSVALNQKERERLRAALAALGLQVLPSQANFLAIGFGRDAAPIHQALLERGVIVRPMGSYELPQFLRMTVGTVDENDRFLASLRDVLA